MDFYVGTDEKSLVPSSAFPLIRQLYTRIRPSSVFSSPRQSLSSLCLFSWERCSSPLITIVVLHGTCSSKFMSFLYWGAQNCAQNLRCWVEKTDALPGPAGNAFSVASQEAADFLYSEGTFLSHGQLVVH